MAATESGGLNARRIYKMTFSKKMFARLTTTLAVAAMVGLGGCAGTDNPVPQNTPPSASVTIDGEASVIVGTSVTLDASATTDPDGDSVRIRWAVSAPEGSEASLSGVVGETAVLTPDVPGTYQITVTASDESSEDTATVALTATEPANRQPEAQAGDGRQADRGTNVVLDGSNSSDPDGDELIFAWEFESKPAESTAELQNADSQTPSFTPDVNGTYVVGLTVTDPDGLSDSDTTTIAVGTDNTPPVADAGDNINAEPNSTVTLTGTRSEDPDGDGLSYLWTIDSEPEGSSPSLSSGTSERAELTVDVEGAYVVELEVTDTGGLSDTDTVTVNVSSDNQPPVARFSVPTEVDVGTTIAVDGTNSTDPNGDTLTYHWDVIESPETTNPSSSTGEVVEVDVFFEGDYTIELRVEDPGGLTDTTTRSFVGVPAGVAPSSPGDLILTEIMYDPETVGDQSGGEWFELYNPSTSETYELENCEISDLDTDSHTINGSVLVAPESYVTLSSGSSPGFSPGYVYGGGYALANGGDELILTCGGTEIDQLAYGSSFSGGSGASAQLDPSFYDPVENDNEANWCASTKSYNGDLGTPGAANDPC
ncbi:MAG: PKD domain-containing protein [Myxococcota bacterium]